MGWIWRNPWTFLPWKSWSVRKTSCFMTKRTIRRTLPISTPEGVEVPLEVHAQINTSHYFPWRSWELENCADEDGDTVTWPNCRKTTSQNICDWGQKRLFRAHLEFSLQYSGMLGRWRWFSICFNHFSDARHRGMLWEQMLLGGCCRSIGGMPLENHQKNRLGYETNDDFQG